MGPVLALFNPVLTQQPLGKYEGARIQCRSENKSCLTKQENLNHISKLNPISNGAHFSPIKPYFAHLIPGQV